MNRFRAAGNAVHTRAFVSPFYKRRFHAFCVGTERSGTHSIAAVLARRYRSDHEPDYPSLIRRLTAPRFGQFENCEVYLRRRDRRLWLEMESCWLHALHVERLARTFPDARFILTIRDCYSWLDSLANHMLANDVGPHWRQAQQAYYQPDQFLHQRGEEAFREAGLYPIRAFLSAWGNHNRRVLEAVPAERLLVVRTSEITASLDRMAAFLDIDPDSIDAEQGHQAAAEHKYRILEQVDKSLLDETVQECCGDVMARWFC